MTKRRKRKFSFKGAVGRNIEKQQRGAQYNHLTLPTGFEVFKAEPGTRMLLDIMPYEVKMENHPDRDDEWGIAVPGEYWYRLPYQLHRNISGQSIVCPGTIGKACPICEHRQELLNDGAEWNDNTVSALKPQQRNIYVVIPKNKNYDAVPHLWDISDFLFQQKLNEEIQENEMWESFPDLEEGYTLRIRFSEEQFMNRKYAETSRIDFVERNKPYDESILDDIPSLDDMLVILSYKQIEAMFLGGLTAEEAEEEVKEEDMYEDDENEIIIEEEEYEEEEDTTPVRKPTSKKPSTKKVVKRTTTKKKKPAEGECPHGFVYADDCEKYPECDDCAVWEACFAASGM